MRLTRLTGMFVPATSSPIMRVCWINSHRLPLLVIVWLKAYFEPNDDERAQGLKRPTAAHRSIAELVAAGAIRVIITTNFDCLLEQALDTVL